MQRIFRIGLHVFPSGPYWVQVNEAIIARLGDRLVPVEMIDPFEDPSIGEEVALAENVLAQDLDAFICVGIHANVLRRMAEAGLPIVYLFEMDFKHPCFISPTGLYDAAYMAANYLARRLGGRGRILAANGYMELNPHAGASRIAGIRDALASFPDIEILHSTTSWRYPEARTLLTAEFAGMSDLPDAVIGLTDDVALAARDAARSLGVPDQDMLMVGINGDPLALAAVLQGSMSATVRTAPAVLAAQATELALQACRGEPWRGPFDYQPHLVTLENAAQIAAESLAELAVLPSRLVGVNRAAEQDRMRHLEVSAGINRHVGSFLNRQRLSEELEVLLKLNYGYDRVHILRWSATDGRLYAEDPSVLPAGAAGIVPESGTPAAAVLRTGKAVLIPDTYSGRRWPLDAAWPDTRTRVLLPIRLGDQILGLLDLHSRKLHPGLRHELVGLQATADQLAIALRNAELYEGAVAAQAESERANQLKTRLLANVSHELRTPLNIIMGYSKAALASPNPYGAALPEPLLVDLQHIFHGGEHLIRLINDLLDLSRAEIGALDLALESVALGPFLHEVYRGMIETTIGRTDLAWCLSVPEHLPPIQADPVRLRQIFLNLLHNAVKFTDNGTITLGAEVEPPYLHLWVADTGAGIPPEQQELIFRPFAKLEGTARRPEGVGLGLSIVRRLVALHSGSITLESEPGAGSVFHVYLPLPTLSGRPVLPALAAGQPLLWLISGRDRIAPEFVRIGYRTRTAIRQLAPEDDVDRLQREAPPSCIAWDIAGSDPRQWAQIERVRAHPQLSQLPFILYAAGDDGAQRAALTNLITKPASTGALLELISALRPADATRPVLIVDDDPAARDLTLRSVGEAFPGWPTATAGGGREALAYLKDHVPALIVLDLVMPEVDGFAVLRELRGDPRIQAVPVLVLSGKLLTLDELLRLNQAGAVFSRKGILDAGEQVELVRSVAESDRLPRPTSELVKRAVARIHETYQVDLSREDLAGHCGVSPGYFSKIFRQEMGLSVTEYLMRFRIQMAQPLLQGGSLSITEVAVRVGFADPAYFSRVFHKITGQSARSYRRNRGR